MSWRSRGMTAASIWRHCQERSVNGTGVMLSPSITTGSGEKPRWNAGHHRIRTDIFRDDRTCTDHGEFADPNTAQDGRVGTDRRAILDEGVHALPLVGDLTPTPAGSRIFVIDEHDAMANEYIVADVHALA